LVLPRAIENADPSWFGFAVTVREGVPFDRKSLVEFLESRRIATRPLFAGNLTRQPVFQGVNYRVSGDLTNTDTVMQRTFWVGVYSGLTEAMMDYVADAFRQFVRQADRASSMAVR
ncbi:MAG TPA: DegT/DnrJ/EryC1/StrS family aminotransferase, partial [Bryobacteraceae bacterium]|nr:DegT/DnrJ/EryC1/StrS family aminotransferase [Bryobacteraceae bacterium]